jgi:Uma2 family endonuclease
MYATTRPMTVDEFEAFVMLPENTDRYFEYFSGEAVERLTRFHAAVLGANILFRLTAYEQATNLPGWFVGAGVCYRISGDLYVSEGSYMPRTRMEHISTEIFCPIPPALVIEIDMQSKYSNQVYPTIKIANFLAAGTIVWGINLLQKRVEVYEPGRSVRVRKLADTLDGGDLLPGFTLPIKDIFPE